jgi:hypothetical protein
MRNMLHTTTTIAGGKDVFVNAVLCEKITQVDVTARLAPHHAGHAVDLLMPPGHAKHSGGRAVIPESLTSRE